MFIYLLLSFNFIIFWDYYNWWVGNIGIWIFIYLRNGLLNWKAAILLDYGLRFVMKKLQYHNSFNSLLPFSTDSSISLISEYSSNDSFKLIELYSLSVSTLSSTFPVFCSISKLKSLLLSLLLGLTISEITLSIDSRCELNNDFFDPDRPGIEIRWGVLADSSENELLVIIVTRLSIFFALAKSLFSTILDLLRDLDTHPSFCLSYKPKFPIKPIYDPESIFFWDLYLLSLADWNFTNSWHWDLISAGEGTKILLKNKFINSWF